MQVIRCLANKKNITINLTVSLGRGGEACIYTVPIDVNLVAKIYHKSTEQQARKLQVMLAHPPENPTASLGHISIAWPTELLYAADESEKIIGFLMPRIRGMRPIIDFYNPRTRRQHCPLFNYQYLLRTARNLAAAFAALHASGYCVGDVNESNILVSDTALVTVVDTDSFQVREKDKNIVYRCPVGKPEFTPPELQHKIFAESDRTFAHDLFGLGVLVFQLLMEGTHPFSGIFQGAGEPPPYEARIASGHFTYSRNRQIPYSATPIAPSWEILHPSLQELFIRCFEDSHKNPLLRPSAQNWLLTLTEIENSLVSCTVNPQHRYSNHLYKCPWCERTLRLGGRDPFPSQQAVASKEHLQPQSKPRKRYTEKKRALQPTIPQIQFAHQQSVSPKNISSYKPPKKAIFHPAIFFLVGFGLLGYLDLMVKFTSRPFIPENNFAQQALMSNQTTATAKSLSFEDYYKLGYTSYIQRDYEQAVEKFTEAIQQQPTYAKAYIDRGNAHYNLKEYEAAIADYDRALKIDPKQVKAYVNMGNSRYILAEYSSSPDRNYNLAITDFNNALLINPQEVEAYIRRGMVRAKMAKYSGDSQEYYKQALDDFNQAINLDASRSEAYFQRGMIRYQVAQYNSNFEQEYKKSIEDFDQALRINPQLAKVYLKRGIIRYELAQYGNQSNEYNKQAIQDLQTAAKISLGKGDMEDYQEALSSICVVLDNKCDAFFQNSASGGKNN